MKKATSVLIFLFLGLQFAIAQDQPRNDYGLPKIWEEFSKAWENGDAKSCSLFFLENAKNFPPQSPKAVIGQSAIEEMYNGLFSEHKSSKYLHKIVGVEELGEALLEEGQLTVDWVRNDESSWQFVAKTLTLWKKNSEGQWKISKFMFN